jgi:acyl-coenzyme A thioesterase PaaI-like protein
MCNHLLLPYYPHCFICGTENQRGLKCRFECEGDTVRSTFATEPWMAGYEGVVHGGLVGAVLDEALVWAAYAKTQRFGVTAEIQVRYLKPLLVGGPCTVEGILLEDKVKMWLAESKVFRDPSQVIARATGKIMPLTGKKQEEFKALIKNHKP